MSELDKINKHLCIYIFFTKNAHHIAIYFGFETSVHVRNLTDAIENIGKLSWEGMLHEIWDSAVFKNFGGLIGFVAKTRPDFAVFLFSGIVYATELITLASLDQICFISQHFR